MSARICGGHVGHRAGGEIFKDEGVPLASEAGQLGREGRGDRLGDPVGDKSDLFIGRDAQARGDSGTSARGELGRVVEREQMGGGFEHSGGPGSLQKTPR